MLEDRTTDSNVISLWYPERGKLIKISVYNSDKSGPCHTNFICVIRHYFTIHY